MNDTELFELCKEVFNKLVWDDTSLNDWGDKLNEYGQLVPLYTSDYLLEKLPTNLADNWLSVGPITNQTKPIHWAASYKRGGLLKLDEWADTPLKALLKLVMTLEDEALLPDEAS